jgi:hypothetical protein
MRLGAGQVALAIPLVDEVNEGVPPPWATVGFPNFAAVSGTPMGARSIAVSKIPDNQP